LGPELKVPKFSLKIGIDMIKKTNLRYKILKL